MNNHLPKIKTIRVMLQEMGEQQQAVFRMAFKMHNTTNYVIVSPDSDEKPDLVLVDTDTPAGVEAWKESKKTYPEVPVAMFSSELPTVTTPYLAKPVKFDTLFFNVNNLGCEKLIHVFDLSNSVLNTCCFLFNIRKC